jgi:hypothetical protein
LTLEIVLSFRFRPDGICVAVLVCALPETIERRKPMRVQWEKLGILGPVYGLVGRGFSNDEIASQLNITETNVRQCAAWLIRFGGHSSREELVLQASATISLDREHGIPPVTRKFWRSAQE